VDACVYNGLECKISCNTSKVSYVLDTEDLFHRRRRGIKAKATRAAHAGGPTPKEKIAAQRFNAFVEKHAGEVAVAMVQ
jgi:paired amphipathic helix protein Sin3a